MLFFLGCVLPYLAAAVFCGGMVRQTARWLRTPAPFPLTLAPPPNGRAAGIAWELLSFRTLWRGERRLWIGAWLTHAALALVLVGHLLGIGTLAQQFTWLGCSAPASVALSGELGMAAGIGLGVGLTALGIRRLTHPQVRRLSSAEDFFVVGLLLAIVATGLALRLGPGHVDLAEVRTYVAGLLSLNPRAIPAQPLLVAHFTLVNLLLLGFPFSKLVHLTGAIVGQALITQPAPQYPQPGQGDAA